MAALSFSDDEFPWGPIEMSATAPVTQLYAADSQFPPGAASDGEIGPASEGPCIIDATGSSRDDIAQGAHPDCFFVSVVTALAHASPQVLARLFVTQHLSPEGEFTCRFFRDDRWVAVTVGDRVPVSDRNGTALFARSPTKRWWPLLLEKAYAGFYHGYGALAGGNTAECFHDLTGAPVRTVMLNASSAVQFKKHDWVRLAAELDSNKVAVCAGTVKNVAALKGGNFGLQPGHAYCIVRVVPEDQFVVLVNPVKNGSEYRGPLGAGDKAFTRKMQQRSGINEKRRDWFPVPFSVLQTHFSSMAIVHLEYAVENAFRGSVPCTLRSDARLPVGGCSSFSSFGAGSLFVVTNPTASHVSAQLVVKQPCQRYEAEGTHSISYQPAAVTVLRRLQNTAAAPPSEVKTTTMQSAGKRNSVDASRYACASPFVTATTWHEISPPPCYMNQRDNAVEVSLPPGESLVVPATYLPLPPRGDADPGAPLDLHVLLYSSETSLRIEPQTVAWPRTPIVTQDIALKSGCNARFTFPELTAGDEGVLSVQVVQPPAATANSATPTGARPDTIGEAYLQLTILNTATGEAIASTVTINYTRLSIAVPLKNCWLAGERTGEVCVDVTHSAKNGKASKAALPLLVQACVSVQGGVPPSQKSVTMRRVEASEAVAAADDVDAGECGTPRPPREANPPAAPRRPAPSNPRSTGPSGRPPAPAAAAVSTAAQRSTNASSAPRRGEGTGQRNTGPPAAAGAVASRGPAAGGGAAAVRARRTAAAPSLHAANGAVRGVAGLYAGLE